MLGLSTHNAKNGKCNVFLDALAMFYKSYTLALHIPNGESQQRGQRIPMGSQEWPNGLAEPLLGGYKTALH